MSLENHSRYFANHNPVIRIVGGKKIPLRGPLGRHRSNKFLLTITIAYRKIPGIREFA